MPAIPRLLRCPSCRGGLAAAEPRGWRCDACNCTFPFDGVISRFVPDSGYAASFARQWKAHARTQLDSHSGLAITRKRFFSVTRWPERMEGQTILEAGCGAGRFTEVVCSTGAEIYSLDLSAAVEANAENNGESKNLHLMQADIFYPPFADGAFDKVFCFGVLQHTPDPEASFHSLTRLVKPGGEIAIDVYRRSFTALLSWKYLLRPLTRRMDKQRLYSIVARAVPPLIPLTRALRVIGGRLGARLSPIVEYSHLGLKSELNRDWAVLDTFDMYSPEYDLPQSEAVIRSWFTDAGFIDIRVGPGPNGVIGCGRKPPNASHH